MSALELLALLPSWLASPSSWESAGCAGACSVGGAGGLAALGGDVEGGACALWALVATVVSTKGVGASG